MYLHTQSAYILKGNYTKHPFTFEGFHIQMEYPVYTNDLPDDCLLILLYSKLNVQKVFYTTNYFTRDSNNNIVTIFQLNLVFHNLNNAVSWNQKSFRSRTHCIYLYYLIAINSCHNQCVRTKIRSDDKKILHQFAGYISTIEFG